MKNFLTSMLGALAALVIFSLGSVVVCFGVLGVVAAMRGDRTPAVERGAYVVFDLETNLTDAPAHIELGSFAGKQNKNLQLRGVTHALRAAAADDRIRGVLLKGSFKPLQYGSGYAALKEVRAALEAVRAAGKPVKAYLTVANTRDFYVASVANEVVLDPYGIIVMPGLASQPVFFAGAFEKYGVGVQVTRVGKYKSYVEPFIRKEMSPENREQIQNLLGDVWGSLLEEIAASRKLSVAQIQGVVDSDGLIRAEVAKKANLVDRVAYVDEVIGELKKETGRASISGLETFKQITLADYMDAAPETGEPAPTPRVEKSKVADKSGSRGEIGLIYAEGDIVDGEGDTGEVSGAKFAREIRRMRQDKNIKAIVLRVNSPGGSASASEAIQREVRLARESKPVIVSMGTYAASGGYWISAYGDRIFAEPTTITGSIGVFGIQFDIKKLANDLGVTFDSVKTGKFADALTIARPKTPEEMEVFQRLVDWIYGEFIGKVSEARKLPRARVEEIAQGRVWSGLKAKELGLVDEIGGLDSALAYAAAKAGLGSKYAIKEYPRPKGLAELIQELLNDFTPVGSRAQTGVVGQVVQRVETELKMLKSFDDPAGLYARLPLDLAIQ
jgi:protease-4